MTRPEQLEATVKAIADHGAAFVGSNVMFLKDGTRDHFLGFIRSEFPQMLQGFERLYAGPYASPGYVASVRAMVATLQKRYDIKPRGKEQSRGNGEEAEEPANERAACEQAAFKW
jgi:hypothetical protein